MYTMTSTLYEVAVDRSAYIQRETRQIRMLSKMVADVLGGISGGKKGRGGRGGGNVIGKPAGSSSSSRSHIDLKKIGGLDSKADRAQISILTGTWQAGNDQTAGSKKGRAVISDPKQKIRMNPVSTEELIRRMSKKPERKRPQPRPKWLSPSPPTRR